MAKVVLYADSSMTAPGFLVFSPVNLRFLMLERLCCTPTPVRRLPGFLIFFPCKSQVSYVGEGVLYADSSMTAPRIYYFFPGCKSRPDFLRARFLGTQGVVYIDRLRYLLVQ